MFLVALRTHGNDMDASFLCHLAVLRTEIKPEHVSLCGQRAEAACHLDCRADLPTARQVEPTYVMDYAETALHIGSASVIVWYVAIARVPHRLHLL